MLQSCHPSVTTLPGIHTAQTTKEVFQRLYLCKVPRESDGIGEASTNFLSTSGMFSEDP